MKDGNYVMIVHPVQAAALEAMKIFEGRNWRRIKREVSKAMKAASLALRKKLN